MNRQEIEDELRELIENFATEHNLFSLKINYEGYHECDYNRHLEDTYCSFVADKMEISIG